MDSWRNTVAVVWIAGSVGAAATTVSWDGGGDGTSWHDPLNWSDNKVPAATNDVLVTVTGSVTVVHSSGTTYIRSISLKRFLWPAPARQCCENATRPYDERAPADLVSVPYSDRA